MDGDLARTSGKAVPPAVGSPGDAAVPRQE